MSRDSRFLINQFRRQMKDNERQNNMIDMIIGMIIHRILD